MQTRLEVVWRRKPAPSRPGVELPLFSSKHTHCCWALRVCVRGWVGGWAVGWLPLTFKVYLHCQSQHFRTCGCSRSACLRRRILFSPPGGFNGMIWISSEHRTDSYVTRSPPFHIKNRPCRTGLWPDPDVRQIHTDPAGRLRLCFFHRWRRWLLPGHRLCVNGILL